jgi:hypothetical protein
MDSKFLRADELGIRLEIVRGLPIWEAQPVYKHQKAVDRIRATIEKVSDGAQSGDCFHAANVYVSFPDGSLKRPDISIFCREPEEEEEAIDLEIGPHFYLSQGVKDVVVFDPYTLLVLHVRRDGATRQVSPVNLLFECGCRCVV